LHNVSITSDAKINEERRMTPSQFVQSADVKLAVYTWGKPSKNKPTVVLVHGYPDAANVWKASAELLAQRYFVVAYDVRGAGNSTRPTTKIRL
jgi:pimeloyl-ACP methyl ester carboxylesterase